MIDPPRRLAAALAGVGAVLCVLGWYQVSGQPTVAQQIPYLASATIPGAALLAVGLALALRGPWSRGGRGGRGGAGGAGGGLGVAPSERTGLWRLPDGRYLHAADCPLLDGRADLLAASEPVGRADSPAAAEPGGRADLAAPEPDAGPALRPCPLCHAGAED